MPWILEYHEDIQIVELRLMGRLNGEELQAAAVDRITLGREKNVDRYIINARELEISRSMTLPIYDIPSKIYDSEGMSRISTIALIAPESPGSDWIVKFFEDLCFNRGWRVETFADQPSAVAWLLKTGE